MRTHARHSRGERTTAALGEEHERTQVLALLAADDSDAAPDSTDDAADGLDAFDEEGYEIFRVHCPDCARPIALLADEDLLPEHALCSSPWNPFGLTVCPGSGRPAADATSADGDDAAEDQDWGQLLTLPDSLDWRTQPFSHVGGPGSQPIRLPFQRAA
ncbi:hypothetical protein ACIP98_06630 [Streptomyces sp. NPDC088354]|uniref:hypothetical protein n=1 Tax=unclassified Streptomyces TaxID=2593676 RepID=UPI0029BA1A98|nr:hypothetical protein [Streptomyces sp. MI02-7b]MDX3071605.1 hypothetical protein [Streptomyces sp. MI02-7b]